MGAFSSEGAMDFALKDLDYALYISFGDGMYKLNIPLVDEMIPFFELTYHGIILYNPISPTINHSIKQKRDQIIYHLRGGKPSFYFYSKFRTGGAANWMGESDLTSDTDENLRESVSYIAEAAKEYAARADRQLVFMKDYQTYENGIEVAIYEDGCRVVGNFSEQDAIYDGHTIPAGEVLYL